MNSVHLSGSRLLAAPPARTRLAAAIVMAIMAPFAANAAETALPEVAPAEGDFAWGEDDSALPLQSDDAADLAAPGEEGEVISADDPLPQVEATAAAAMVPPATPPRALAVKLDNVAAHVAYDALQQSYRGPTQRKAFAGLAVDGAVQVGEWSLHARQLHTRDDRMRQASRMGGYLQRSVSGGHSVLQAGQVAVANPVLAGPWMDGVQWASTAALGSWGGQAARVEGVAHSRARVEIRQSGQLLHVAVVPAGPFVLDDIPGVRRGADLWVKVVEEDGSERQFNVAHALAEPLSHSRGLALAAGQVRVPAQARSQGQGAAGSGTPWVVSAGWAGRIAPGSTASVGALLGEGYQAVGAALTDSPWAGAAYQVSLQQSRTTAPQARRGQQWGLAYSEQLDDAWSMHATYNRRSAGYRDLLQHYAPGTAQQIFQQQWGLALQTAIGDDSVLSLGYQRGRLFDGSTDARGVISWSRPVRQAQLALSGEWGQRRSSGGKRVGTLQATLTVPLGRAHRAQVAAYQRGPWEGGRLQVEGAPDPQLHYRAGLQARAGQGRGTGGAVGVSLLPAYAQLDADLSWPSPGLATRQLALRGGLVVAKGSLLLTPPRPAPSAAAQLQPLGRAPQRQVPVLLHLEDVAQAVPGTPVVDAQGVPVAVVQRGRQVLLRTVPGQAYWLALPGGQRCALELDRVQEQDGHAFFRRAVAACHPGAGSGYAQVQ